VRIDRENIYVKKNALYKERKKGLEERFIPRWVRIDERSHHSLQLREKLGRRVWRQDLDVRRMPVLIIIQKSADTGRSVL
jgi:hypothetical protein